MDRRRPGAIAPIPRPARLSGVLLRGLRDALRGAPMKETARRRLTAMGFIEKNPAGFSRLTASGLEALRAHTRTD